MDTLMRFLVPTAGQNSRQRVCEDHAHRSDCPGPWAERGWRSPRLTKALPNHRFSSGGRGRAYAISLPSASLEL